jgi:hypothetical protein
LPKARYSADLRSDNSERARLAMLRKPSKVTFPFFALSPVFARCASVFRGRRREDVLGTPLGAPSSTNVGMIPAGFTIDWDRAV